MMSYKSDAAEKEAIMNKLDTILTNEKKIMDNQDKILAEEKKVQALELQQLEEERNIEELERQQLNSDENLESLEKEEIEEIQSLKAEIEKDLRSKVMKKITYRDFTKAAMGAFFGVVGHFAFAKGPELAAHYTLWRSNFLLLTSFLIVITFVYFTGFREIEDKKFMNFIPVRVFVIFFTAMVVNAFVLAIFGKIYPSMGIELIYKTLAAVSILATIGASTADLIGKE